MNDDDVEDLTMLELQRERLRSARERQAYLAMIAQHSRWTAIILAAHAGVGVLQDPPMLASQGAAVLVAVALVLLPAALWRR